MSMLPMPFILWGSIKFTARIAPRYSTVREKVGRLNRRLANNLGGIATIMMWLFVFNPDAGLLNMVIRPVYDVLIAVGVLAEGTAPPAWIYDSGWSKPSLIIMAVWGVGGAMLIFLAGLQNVPDQLYEAADIDGAGRWGKFISVTVPQLTPTIFFNLVMGMIQSVQAFTQIYIVSEGTGEPAGWSLVLSLHLFLSAFQDLDMGYASAMAWILFGMPVKRISRTV